MLTSSCRAVRTLHIEPLGSAKAASPSQSQTLTLTLPTLGVGFAVVAIEEKMAADKQERD